MNEVISVVSLRRNRLTLANALRLIWLVLAILASGCALPDLGYYWQGARGQLQMLHAARPLAHWFAEPDLPAKMRDQLLLAQQARDFASQALALPDNASYRRYADLGRDAAVWNVTAAAPDALQLHRWCFAIAGCVGYRGYFALSDAQAQAKQLADAGFEVHVYPVPAYSTLGYLNWLGGDPLLNTFVLWPEGELVGLLFHELSHQRIYLASDMAFNESYATAVQRLGTSAWLRQSPTAAAAAPAWQAAEQRRRAFRTLTQKTRAALETLYAASPAPSAHALATAKSQIFGDFRARYQGLRTQWLASNPALLSGAAAQALQRLDLWVAEANNASFGALTAYDLWVPAFIALFEQQAQHVGPGQAWPAFHSAVEQLASLPETERMQALCALMPRALPAQPPACMPGP